MKNIQPCLECLTIGAGRYSNKRKTFRYQGDSVYFHLFPSLLQGSLLKVEKQNRLYHMSKTGKLPCLNKATIYSTLAVYCHV